MARKVKRKRTAQKRKTNRRVATKKTSKNSSYLAIIVVIIVFVFAIYYFSFNKGSQQQPYQQTGETPSTAGSEIVTGGLCKKNSECFMTYCKGQAENCVNTTQLSFYSRNCKTYSDWIIENQDFSKCSCVQNACMIVR